MKAVNFKCLLTIVLLHLFAAQAFSVTAKFSYTKRSNCAPTIVEFINASTAGAGITYTWNFGLGAVVSASDNAAKEQVYSKPGQYKVTLIVSDGVNKDSTSTIITISQGPKAGFTAVPEHGCAPLPVTYTSTSSAGDAAIVSTSWDFRNGDHANGNSVAYTYQNTGTYDIVLKVTDKSGCYSVAEVDSMIRVVKKPTVNFTASDTFACTPPLNVTFKNTSNDAANLTYRWDYGNGKTSTDLSNSSVYSSTGTYDVKLTATNQYGCSDSLIKKSYVTIGNAKGTISVYNSANKIVTGTKLCKGVYSFVFSNHNMPDYTWTIYEDGTTTTITGKYSITYVAKDTGTVNISLVYGRNLSCTDSIKLSYTKNIVIADFKPDVTLFCSVPEKINFHNLSKNASSYSWYFSGQLISNSPDTSFILTKNNLPAETYQQIYSREISSLPLPFKLVATSSNGCADSITKVTTLSIPVTRFMPDKVSGCAPLQVTFSDSSKSLFPADEYDYKIGAFIVTSATRDPVKYTFTKPGEYYVSEIIKSGTCTDTSYAVKIVVGEKLKPDVTVVPAEVCNGGKIHVAGNSGNNSVVTSWHLTSTNLFDFNFTSKPDTFLTVYSDSTGYKNVSLQLNYNGCMSDTIKKAIFKINGPAGNFFEMFRCDTPLVYHFKSKITPATTLLWNVDTAVLTAVDSLRYKFPKSGDYTVKLTATDNASNCQLSKSKLIKVRQIKAAFSLADSIFCSGDTAHLNASLSKDYITECHNEGFLWDFGDNTPSRRTFSTTWDHIYTAKGKFKLLLTAKADNGCIDSVKRTVYVHQPTGHFTTDKNKGCVPSLKVNFQNTSTDSTIVSWVWNFGDKSTDSTKTTSVMHTYTSSKEQTFNPSLTVYDAYQCYSSFSLPVTLIGINADFQADDNAICLGKTIAFTPVDKTLDSLFWIFGDGSSSATDNTHTYNQKGLFTVSLAASKNGCRDTLSKSNYISVEKADAGFTLSDSVFYCYPDTVRFIHRNLNGSPAVDRLWSINSHDLTGVNADSLSYVFTKPGNYKTQLTVRTLNSCQASSSKNLVITGPSASFSFSPKKICYNGLVNFQMDSLKQVTSWKWLFGDGSSSVDNPASHRYTSRGSIVPSIVLTNKDCSATNTLDTLFISTVKADFYNAGNSSKICYGNKLDLLNRSTDSKSWNWQIDNVTKSIDYNYGDILLTKLGDYNIKLIVTGADQCTDTLVKTYSVIANPVFSISGDSIMCKGQQSISLSVKNDPGWTIKWTPTQDVSDPMAFTTVVRPSKNETFTAQVTDAYGCVTTREKTIVYNQPFHLTRTPVGDASINIGETIQLTVVADTGKVDYSWTPNYNITCLTCNNPYVSPTKDATYKVEVKNACYDFIEDFNIKVIIDFYLEAPTAFSPNGDSNNDIYKFENENIKNFDLKIFNRWGEQVFSSNDVLQGWDGKVNGKAQNIDTYTYIVKAESVHGYKFEKSGSFLLLK